MKKYFSLLLFAAVTLTTFTLQSCCLSEDVTPDPKTTHTAKAMGTAYENDESTSPTTKTVLKGVEIQLWNGSTLLGTTTTSSTDGTFEFDLTDKTIADGTTLTLKMDYNDDGVYENVGTITWMNYSGSITTCYGDANVVKSIQGTTSRGTQATDPENDKKGDTGSIAADVQMPISPSEEGSVTSDKFAYSFINDVTKEDRFKYIDKDGKEKSASSTTANSNIVMTSYISVSKVDRINVSAAKSSDPSYFIVSLEATNKPTITIDGEVYEVTYVDSMKVAFDSDVLPDTVSYTTEEGIVTTLTYDKDGTGDRFKTYTTCNIDGKTRYFFYTNYPGTLKVKYIIKQIINNATTTLVNKAENVSGPQSSYKFTYKTLMGVGTPTYTPTNNSYIGWLMKSQLSNYESTTRNQVAIKNIAAGESYSFYAYQIQNTEYYEFLYHPEFNMTVIRYTGSKLEIKDAREHTGGSN